MTQPPGPGLPPFGQEPQHGQPGQGGYPPVPPPPAYGAVPPGTPPYAAPPYPRTSGKATAILVLGIVSLVMMCGYGVGVIPAIVALAMAPSARREIKASGGWITGEGNVTAGVVCSWITVGVVAAAVVGVIVIAVIAAAVNT